MAKINLSQPFPTVLQAPKHVILLVQSVLYFFLRKMFEMQVWTETAKKLECMRNILYMLYNLQPNHGRFIRITVYFVFAES